VRKARDLIALLPILANSANLISNYYLLFSF